MVWWFYSEAGSNVHELVVFSAKNLYPIEYIKYQVWNYVERKLDLSQDVNSFTTFLYKKNVFKVWEYL